MGITEEYKRFNDEKNPDGRSGFTKTSLYDAAHENSDEEPAIHFFGPQLDREDREWYIRKRIASEKTSVKEFMDLADKYPNNCIDALNILDIAKQGGRLEEFKGKLNSFYEKNIRIYDWGILDSFTYSRIIKEFFMECYGELGIPVKITDL